MSQTEVILTAHIPSLGAEADVVKVRRGYARNFLIPRGMAHEVTPATLRMTNSLKARRAEREAKELNEANDLAGLLATGLDSLWRDMAKDHLCLISNDMFAHFARHACEVAQHVSINDITRAAEDKKLFNQENVPSETLFYSVLTEIKPGTMSLLKVPEILQIGGDATTGLGYCSTHLG